MLAQELNRLNKNDYTWDDEYTQCILKSVLNDRPRIVYEPEKCDQFRRVEVGQVFDEDEDGGGVDKVDGGNNNNNINPLGPAVEKFLQDQLASSKTVELPSSESSDDVIQSDSEHFNHLSSFKHNTNTNTNKKQNDKIHTTPSSFSFSSFPPIYPQESKDIVFDQLLKPVENLKSRAMINVDKKKCNNIDCSHDDDVELLLEQTGGDIGNVVDLPPINYQEDETLTNDKNIHTKEYYKRLLLSYLGRKEQEDEQTNALDIDNGINNDIVESNNIDYWDTPNDRVLREINYNDDVNNEEDQSEENAGVVIFEENGDQGDTLGDNQSPPVLFINKKGETFAIIDGKKEPLDTDNEQVPENSPFTKQEDDEDDEIDEQILKEIPLEEINYSNNNDDDEQGGNFNRMHRYDTKKPGPRYIEEYFFENISTKNDAKTDMDKVGVFMLK